MADTEQPDETLHADIETMKSENSDKMAMPLKQKVAVSFKSLVAGAASLVLGGAGQHAGGGPAPMAELFTKTDPAVDGDECSHDCDSCTATYPRGFKIDEEDLLYGHVKGWSVHMIVATGKTDWKRDVEDESGSVMEAVGKASLKGPDGGRVMLSASDLSIPGGTRTYSVPTRVLLLPAFTLVENVTPALVSTALRDIVSRTPSTSSPLQPVATEEPGVDTSDTALKQRPCPHAAVILLCSQRTRDARCGQSAPILRRELERHLRPLGLLRDAEDERPGGVAVHFISHVGGHKYSANVMVYRRRNAFGLDDPALVEETNGQGKGDDENEDEDAGRVGREKNGEDGGEDVGAAQCIWLARVKPEDCENLVRFTVMRGKVVKPETQLRGGFDRSKGLLSW